MLIKIGRFSRWLNPQNDSSIFGFVFKHILKTFLFYFIVLKYLIQTFSVSYFLKQ